MEKRLTKEQWLNLFEKNEFVENLEERISSFESDEIISSEKMIDIIRKIDFEKEYFDWNCGSYNIDEVISLYRDFEENKEFLMNVAELFE